MTNYDFTSLPANNYAESDNSHYNVSLNRWFHNYGSYLTYPDTFTPTLGNTNVTLNQNVNPNSNYVKNITDPFWPSEGKYDHGFTITKPSTTSMVEYNVKVSGGGGNWMPCPIFRSLSFYWENETNANSNFVPKSVALSLMNARTGEEKYWGSGWSQASDPSRTGRLYILNGANKTKEVRNMGPDWFINGVVINFKSNSTSGAQAPRGTFADFRLGHLVPSLGPGANRIILPKEQSFSEFSDSFVQGNMQYAKIQDPPPWEDGGSDSNYKARYHIRKSKGDIWSDGYFAFPLSTVSNIYEVDSGGHIIRIVDKNNEDDVGGSNTFWMRKNGDYVITTSYEDRKAFKDGAHLEFLNITDISRLTTMSDWFESYGRSDTSSYIKGLQYFNTSNITSLSYTFNDSRGAILEGIESWDVSKVIDFGRTFANAGMSRAPYNLDLSKWNTSKAENMDSMFRDSAINPGNIGTWDVSKTKISGYYQGLNGFFRAHKDTSYKPDLRSWCVSQFPTEPSGFTDNKSDWNTKPVWGTCP